MMSWISLEERWLRKYYSQRDVVNHKFYLAKAMYIHVSLSIFSSLCTCTLYVVYVNSENQVETVMLLFLKKNFYVFIDGYRRVSYPVYRILYACMILLN